MAKHLVKEVETALSVAVYEVEADSPEEALDLYVTDLAGTLEPVNEYVTEVGSEPVDITIINK